MPGAPPMTVTDPGTRPPPSTRSTSPTPVVVGERSSVGTSPTRRAGSAATGPDRPTARTASSVRVFHSPHVGHCPAHWGDAPPQDEQRWTVRDRLMARTYGGGVTASRKEA